MENTQKQIITVRKWDGTNPYLHTLTCFGTKISGNGTTLNVFQDGILTAIVAFDGKGGRLVVGNA